MRGATTFLLLGGIFGFALSRVGASEYDLIYGMFTGTDLTLAWVMIMAIAVGHLGMRLLNALGGNTRRGEKIEVKAKPLRWGTIFGGLMMGVGWGLSGACPGTVLAQLGEGKILALATVLGLISGTYFYALLVEWKSSPGD
ncbi:MAG: DUF6691 family protein [Clostridia bacterium]